MTKRGNPLLQRREPTLTMQSNKTLRNDSLRYNEYYDVQNLYDELYSHAKSGGKFFNLMDKILHKENILVAYRKIKTNNGSLTAGHNKHTINDLEKLTPDELVLQVRKRLANYHPHKVERVMIPKANGKLRPLGIPTIEDRLVQQCIRQVLEPICEAKFYDYSFGFRPNRSTTHAMARCYHLMQRNNLHFVVDIDIKGFFDNVNHGKLMKQLWHLGIRDKTLFKLISKMLKAEIIGEGIPTKGTPQGGILSPLLSNVVLNELDWWIHSQWNGMKTRHNYSKGISVNRALKSTKLKEMHIVRYADDFKIFCRTLKEAKNIKIAVTQWLQERLHLEVSEEKSKIVNLKKKYSDFLGFKMKVVRKGIKWSAHKASCKDKFTVRSHMNQKAFDQTVNKIKTAVKQIQHGKPNELPKNIGIYNATIAGLHNYYDTATHISKDFHKVDYLTIKIRKNRFKDLKTKTGTISKFIEEKYGDSKGIHYLCKMAIIPLAKISHKAPMQFTQEISSYSESGRQLIHKKLNSNIEFKITLLMRNPVMGETVEYNDNRLSRFSAQKGKCAVTKMELEVNEVHCHHQIPRHLGGDDKYSNLIIVHEKVHQLIHVVKNEVIERLVTELNLNDDMIKKVNTLRRKCKLETI